MLSLLLSLLHRKKRTPATGIKATRPVGQVVRWCVLCQPTRVQHVTCCSAFMCTEVQKAYTRPYAPHTRLTPRSSPFPSLSPPFHGAALPYRGARVHGGGESSGNCARRRGRWDHESLGPRGHATDSYRGRGNKRRALAAATHPRLRRAHWFHGSVSLLFRCQGCSVTVARAGWHCQNGGIPPSCRFSADFATPPMGASHHNSNLRVGQQVELGDGKPPASPTSTMPCARGSSCNELGWFVHVVRPTISR